MCQLFSSVSSLFCFRLWVPGTRETALSKVTNALHLLKGKCIRCLTQRFYSSVLWCGLAKEDDRMVVLTVKKIWPGKNRNEWQRGCSSIVIINVHIFSLKQPFHHVALVCVCMIMRISSCLPDQIDDFFLPVCIIYGQSTQANFRNTTQVDCHVKINKRN